MNSNVYLGIAIALGAGAALFYVGTAEASSGETDVNDRGFRNNNPLNMRYIPPPRNYNGQIGQDSGGYGIYDTTAHGVRAAGEQLTSYYGRGLQTIAAMISTWAPSIENDTSSYINDVSQRAGIPADQILSWPSDQLDVMQAMVWHENGSNPFSDTQMQDWINS